MSLTPKTDVKNHLFARGRARNHLHLAPSEAEVKVVSEAEHSEAKVDSSRFDRDFIGEHTPHGIRIVPAVRSTGSNEAKAADISGSPQE